MSKAVGPDGGLDLGLVVAGHGRHYVVETPDGERLICHPRGKKSDAVVGDRVRWMVTSAGGDEGVIEHVEPRRNLLFRQDEWRTKAFAANLDQILVMVASDPVFSESQLARALVAAESAGIDARVLLNKADLPQIVAARERLKPYAEMGYGVVEVALKARKDEARTVLEPLLAGKATLVLGPSGAGKSTLINLLAPHAKAQVGEISQALNSGRHTTTTTQWYWLDGERTTALIDSPGFQEFGLRQIDAQQLPGLMPDLREHAKQCRFYNCTHRQEPGCGVRAALERGEINASRYRIYGEVLAELTPAHR
ncbi:ribosome small subunit-dependent GTPase A [Piscinibacter sp.]|uniref:ribosome small subunit-dependent GTPase A n=1 Tax=Piscinibacter sp. TaxID=1903157 RepID=UPI002BC1B3F1|nr:ribosome small subunit-dependent GTPase A [Albitalea sp.]HUG24853.1 ribosome small subunit-dependent GTPase A [Albitalea sp.]